MAQDQTQTTADRAFWRKRPFSLALAGTIVVLLAALVGVVIWLDSEKGHAFVIAQIEQLEREDGLEIGIGSIEGSIYGSMRIVDLELRDPEGPFFQAGSTRIEWRPTAWIFNELNMSRAIVDQARLERYPSLIDTGRDRPLLPEFDIYVAEFRMDDLALSRAVAGAEQQASFTGAIDVRAGRAMVNLDAATARSGDKLVLNLNAEPENQRLDLNADITAPSGGAIARFLGLENDSSLIAEGEGDWQSWDGIVEVTSDDRKLAQLNLSARDGLFGYDGTLVASLFPGGLVRNLAGPQLALDGNARIEDGRVALDARMRSAAATLTAKGGLDARSRRFDAMRMDLRVDNPSALAPSLRAQDLEMRALLNGPVSELRYQYLLTAPQLAIGKTLLTGIRAEGTGNRNATGWDFPVQFQSGSLIGNGELLQQLASDLKGDGFFRLEGSRLVAGDVRLSTRTVAGLADVEAGLGRGDLVIQLDAQAPGILVRGVGLADIVADVTLETGDRGLALDGNVIARMRRMDNEFLGGLTGGLPMVETGLSLGPERRLQFDNLRIKAPDLQFEGQGTQRSAAEFAFSGSGEHDQYGVFDLELDGRLARPTIAVLLDSPLPAAGLSQVQLNLDPVENGFAFKTAGGSTLGPFDGDGRIVVVQGQQAVVRINRLRVSETIASGNIRPTRLGLAGNLAVTGGGVEGNVVFEPGESADGRSRQSIQAQLQASNARFEGEPPIVIRTGSLDADILLVENSSDITATIRAQGIRRGNFMIGRVAGNARLSDGNGQATFSIAGTRGSSFEFQARADIAPDRYVMTGNGEFEGRGLRFSRPLELRRTGDGWIASPTLLQYGNGTARLSGKWGADTSRLDLALTHMPLSLLDIVYDELELGGEASGTVKLTQSGARMPVGNASLKIRDLTRSGLILTSTPVNLGLNIAISRRNAAARGVIQSRAGKTIGRFQGRVTGLGDGPWETELRNRPLFAQARFNGAAESLWRLTGVETFDLTGPVAMSADIGGTLAKPEIEGQLRTMDARLESPLTGTVISGIKASGEFDGSRLVLPAVSGVTRGGGTVSGSGSFNFAGMTGEGIGINLDVNAERAALIARDDFAATVSGPIKIRSSPEGGQISGDVVLNRSFFQFGQASETVALPDVGVTEINRRADERPLRTRSRPWRFAINANAPNRLQVEGLGLNSEWRANLRVTGPVDNFALSGSANLVRGNYTFAGRRFQLERGRIRFVGNRPPNPVLDIEAEANLTGLNATINVTGTGNRPEIAFNSVPALPEDELLSRILFGASISDLSAPEAVQLAAAVASLNSGGGLDPINQLRRAVGLDRLRILPSDTDAGSGTSIAAGKYITRRAYVELITDGKGYSATRLEFQITRWLSILSSISTLGRQSANIKVSRDY